MTSDLQILALNAAAIGFIHTLIGPDHYLPFIVIARARQWSGARTALITLACGIGHVGSSVLLGLGGVALGVGLQRLELVESVRGEIAAWALIAFGLVYAAWGMRRAWRRRPHAHLHVHGGTVHTHEHSHDRQHGHVHAAEGRVSITPWVLFVVFVFGPCEALIPLFIYPAATHSLGGAVAVTASFSVATIGTMLVLVLGGLSGVRLLPLGRLERYSHALAGGTIVLAGLAIQTLGL